MSLSEGTRLGRYEIRGLLGAGGMGEVYRAHDHLLGRDVAVKVLPRATSSNADRLRRFAQEAKAAAALNHPNVIVIHDFGTYKGSPYLVTELLEGHTLRERLRAGALNTRKAILYGLQVAQGLAAAHARGIVHRDLKPENLFFTLDGRIKILDFGLAKLRGPVEPGHADGDIITVSRSEVGYGQELLGTQPGSRLGTVGYMSPEQVRTLPVDQRSDLFSFGSILFEMLTGQRAFKRDTDVETLAAILNDEPPQLPQPIRRAAPTLARVVLRCLEKRPEDRFQSAPEVASALETLSERSGETTPRPRKRPRPTRDARRCVAILGFKNLSGRADAAWLSTAFAEMLTSELATGDRLRTVPGETVARVKTELMLNDAASLAPETLARVRGNLGADVVVLGSYLAAGRTGQGRLRLDVRLQDAVGGDTIGSITETGAEGDVIDLISRAGARLREHLGGGQLTITETRAFRTALPSNLKGLKLYAQGLARLRLFDAIEARDLLQRAVACDRKSPLAHAALADAYSSLHYEAKAKAAARRALELAGNLSSEDRLLLEARYRVATLEWKKAADNYQCLFALMPDNIEHGLHLVEALARSGGAEGALETVAALRLLPRPAGEDPRIDLAEAWAWAGVDYAAQTRAAGRAAETAERQGARLLGAEARFVQGVGLFESGRLAEARAVFEDSGRLFESTGNRWGQARALNNIGNILWAQGELEGAQRLFEEALALNRAIGSKWGEAIGRNKEGAVLEARGDLTSAGARYEKAIAIFRALEERTGVISHMALAAVFLKQGQPAKARKIAQAGLAMTGETGDRSIRPWMMWGLAAILAEEDRLLAAKKLLSQGLEITEQSGQGMMLDRFRIALANWAVESGRVDEAEILARAALDSARHERPELEAQARIELARALLAKGKPEDAVEAIGPALTHTGVYVDTRLRVVITSALCDAVSGRPGPALIAIESAIAEADQIGLTQVALRARLVAAEIGVIGGREPAAAAALDQLERNARTKGFVLIARRAAEARANLTTERTTAATRPRQLRSVGRRGTPRRRR